jgi:2-C-methyl-D-erythritol 2,4-cyclodiphosphate synthase
LTLMGLHRPQVLISKVLLYQLFRVGLVTFDKSFETVFYLNSSMAYRIGLGTDFHQLVMGRRLWLGGIEIPHSKGALGHSDADVLLHAVCDALLGALGLGDIGLHFPDSDNTLKDIDSKILLEKSYQLIRQKGFRIVNLDTVVCLEKPKIMNYAPGMRAIMAGILEISSDDVSIKATTTEKLGFIGREEGVMAQAVVLLRKTD